MHSTSSNSAPPGGEKAAVVTSPRHPSSNLQPVKKQESILQRLVSASFGAAATVLFTSPMDVVKVRQQSASSNTRLAAAQLEEQLNAERMENPLIRCPACGVIGRHKASANGEAGAAACLHPNHQGHHQHHHHTVAATQEAASAAALKKPPAPPPPIKTSAFATLSSVVKNEGFKALWSGLKPGLIMSLPSTTLYFAVYEELREYFDGKWKAHQNSKKQGDTISPAAASVKGEEVSAVAPMAAGIISRVFTVAVVSPLELIRTKEMYRRTGRPLVKALVEEVRGSSNNIFSLWRGFGATVWRDVPFSGVYWFTYENSKTFLTNRRKKTLMAARAGTGAGAGAGSDSVQLGMLDTFGVSFGSGVAAGGLSALITTPWDVIKTRTQVAGLPGQPGAASQGAAGQLPSGTAAALLHIARHEGVPGLFAGVTARVAKVAPACAIMIGSYELGKLVFARFFNEAEPSASGSGSGSGEREVLTAGSVAALAKAAAERKKAKGDEASL